MDQIIEFATNHAILVSAFLLVSGLLIHNLVAGGSKTLVDPHQAVELINREEAVVVDVRPVADFSKGHIVNAINLPTSGSKKQINRLQKYQDRPIVVACRSGAQSAQACRELRRQGFGKVFNLRGGILAWENANLPVTRKK